MTADPGDRAVSCAQKRLWILDRLHPGSAAYAVPLVHRIDGDLDIGVLERSLSEVVRRHEILRTGYRMRSGALRQFVRAAEPVRIPLVDVSAYDAPRAEADRRAAAAARRPFDLATDPVIRPLLLRLAPRRHHLCLTLHHIACDGWSLDLLQRELSACYTALLAGASPELPPLRAQYADYAEEQAAGLTGPALLPAREYWLKHLSGIRAPATLSADRPRPPVRSFEGGHVRFTVDPPVVERVALLARSHRASPFAVLLAAFAALIWAEGGGDEAVIGTPVTCRRRESQYAMVGMFVNTVVHRLRTSETLTFRELVHRARDEGRQAMAHQALPFEVLVEELNPVRDPGFNPVFQLMLGYHEGDPAALALPGCTVATELGDTATAKLDLFLSLTRTGGRYVGRLEYSTDLFTPTTAHRIADRFRTLLATATEDPLRPLTALCGGSGSR
ncbi:condensation domain-containing protein [Streptomyces sp. NPDC000987]|uniref:condensation domain-containing protein n=1 Tax=Streptomyces sp. NPDC000987 TaxID=3154374 RepID=UPI0033223B93